MMWIKQQNTNSNTLIILCTIFTKNLTTKGILYLLKGKPMTFKDFLFSVSMLLEVLFY